ncbi:MAG: transporter [Gemmiger sp.]
MSDEEKRQKREQRWITRAQLHKEEERIKHAFRDQIAELAGLLEVFISIVVLVGLVFGAIPLLQWMPGLLADGNGVDVQTFLERALDIVIGVEFIKMLAKHSPGSSLEVLLYAIARHLVVGHATAAQTLVSVASIALIFIIRKHFFVPAFGTSTPGGKAVQDEQPLPEDDPDLTYT